MADVGRPNAEKTEVAVRRHEHAVHMHGSNIRYLARAKAVRDWIVGPLVHHLAAFTIAAWHDPNVVTPPRCCPPRIFKKH
jgi:hypothetical protein